MKKNLALIMVFLSIAYHHALAQEIVSGKVTDDTGTELPGASIIINGTTKGTVADINGDYQIEVGASDVLVFSFIGHVTQEITVGSQTSINVTLVRDNTQLEEIVVTAMGIVRKPDEITTSNQVIQAKEINQASNPDAVQALSGKVTGLQVNTTSAGLNPSTQITLRGTRSISGNNSALVVIDNIISSAAVLSTIDPNTIESINVIKGANGAALYGERGAAGVLIVTTKKGARSGEKLSVNLTSSVTMEEIAYLPETQDRFGQGWGGNIETVDQGSWGVPYTGILTSVGTPDANGNYRYFPYSHIEDNILPFFETGITFQNSISLSAGSADDSYINLSYQRQDVDGVISNSNLGKNNFALTTGKKIGNFSLQAIGRFTEQSTDDVNSRDIDNKRADNTYPVISMYQMLSNTPGNVPIEAFNSGDNNDHWTIYDTSPYWMLKNSRQLNDRRIIDLTGQLSYEFNEHINAVLRSSVRNIQNEGELRRNGFIDDQGYVFGDRSIRSFYQLDTDNLRRTYTDFLVNLDYNLTNDITFKSNIGFNATTMSFSRQVNGGYDLAKPNFFHLSNITAIPDYFELNNQQSTVSVFGQVDLGYRDYLFLNLTGRNDWNSVLPENNRSFFYPAIGAAFIPTRAIDGLRSTILHKAKVSASYVITGNATAIDPQGLSTVANVNTFYPSTGLVSLTSEKSLVDQNIKNEFVSSFEANLNLELLNYNGPMVTLDASVSVGNNKDQILNISSSSATGFTNVLMNLGATKTNALELDLGITPLVTEDFELKGLIGFSTFKTKVNEVTPQSDRVEVFGTTGTIGAYAIKGEQFPLLLGTAYQRDDQGRVVVDADGTPLIDSELQVLGKTTPDYILNFGLNATYKGIRAAVVADYRTGHVFYSGIRNQLSGQGRTIESTFNDRIPFVFPNSTVEETGTDNTDVITYGSSPDVHPYNNAYSYYTGDHNTIDENFITDATAFKIREVSVSYDLPALIIDKLSLTRLNIGVSARNLWSGLGSDNLGYNDPEFAGRFGIANYGITPPTRFYAVSINASF